MNTAQILERIRDQVDDFKKLKHSDAEIIRYVDEQLRGLYRTMIFTNQEWSNMSVGLADAGSRKLFADTYEWRLPTWIEKVVKVYRRNPTDVATEGTFSPYLWTSDANRLDEQVQKTDAGRRSGWSWEGNHTFRMWNWTQPKNFMLLVAALPPPVFKLTLTNAHASPDAQKLYLPAFLGLTDLGDLSFTEEGRYINAEIEVTGTAGAADTKFGDVRRVIYSTPTALDAGTRRHELRLEFAANSVFAVGDTIQTRIPLPEIHNRLLILQVTNACAIKKYNVDLQKAIYPEMATEKKAFAEYAQGPRDSTGPFFKTSNTQFPRRPFDANRLTHSPYGW